MSLAEKYKDILNEEHLKANVKVQCSVWDIANGMQPHVQPGVMLPYHTGSQMHATYGSYNHTLTDSPQVHVNFEVRDFDLDKLRPTPNEETPAIGTLQLDKAVKVLCEIGADKLHPHAEHTFEDVQPGQAPHYSALRYVCEKRAMAIQAFQSAEARSSHDVVQRVNDAISRRHSFVADEQYINTIRAAYSAESYAGPQTFQTGHSENFAMYRMGGFTYANPLGMDVPMRAMQITMQMLTATMNLDSMEHIQTFFDSMAQHSELQNYDGSEKADAQLRAALNDSLNNFGLKLNFTRMQAQLGLVADALPTVLETAKAEAELPLAQELRKAMEHKSVFGSSAPMSTQVLTYGRFEHMVKQQLSVGDTLADAEKHAVQRTIAECRNPQKITNVIMPGDDAPDTPGDNCRDDIGDEEVGDDTP